MVIDSYPVKFRGCGNPIDRAAIADCERQLGIAFPTRYTDFLLEHNGGSPSPACLPGWRSGWKVKKFYSVGNHGLVENCERLRTGYGLPGSFLPIVLLGGSECYLLLDCSEADAGSLWCWSDLAEGFRHRNAEYSNTYALYFGIEELFMKFGPATKRQDPDGMFFRLSHASVNPARGTKLAMQLVAEGYDINFVPPTFRHPIFSSIDSEAFGVTATLLNLGTHLKHLDSLHENATIEERLIAEQTKWSGLLQITRANQYDTGIGIATRRLSGVESALEILRAKSP